MNMARLVCSLVLVTVIAASALGAQVGVGTKRGGQWRALHLIGYGSDADLEALGRNIPKLAAMGVNVLILEVNYNFSFKSHPELRRGAAPITKEGARKFSELCRKNGIRLIPQFQSLGHQSWAAETFPLLTKYPEFDLTPGAFPANKGKIKGADGDLDFYCREWDPLNPAVNRVVFRLMDEIIDAFRADALHVGMDEVFLLGSEHSPSTRGKDPAVLFAKAVNDLHRHLVGRRHVEMLMWGDRLIDGREYDFGEWEASMNGTAGAVDLIPKDIIICPWHYEKRDTYPSIPVLLGKGFRVLPAGWNKVEATRALIEYDRKQSSPKMLGHLFTTWGVKKKVLTEYPPLVEGLKLTRAGSSSA
ncbi:MAG: family 20 glycosylhydrolase [Pyrinomonadaceae bacterium]